jgi:hypothetical protein
MALSPGGPQLLAHKHHRLVLVQIAALTDAGYKRAQVVGPDCAVDDLALAQVRLSGMHTQDRRDLCVGSCVRA